MAKLLLVFLDKKEDLKGFLWQYNFQNPKIEKGFHIVIGNEEEENPNRMLRGVLRQEEKIKKLKELRESQPLEYFLDLGYEVGKDGCVGRSFIIEKKLSNWSISEKNLLVTNSGDYVNSCDVKEIAFNPTWERLYEYFISNYPERKEAWKPCIDATLDSDGWDDLSGMPVNMDYLVVYSIIEKYWNKDITVFLVEYE